MHTQLHVEIHGLIQVLLTIYFIGDFTSIIKTNVNQIKTNVNQLCKSELAFKIFGHLILHPSSKDFGITWLRSGNTGEVK